MGNMLYISANRAISDEKFTEMLTTVVKENYSDYYEVKYLSDSTWNIQPKNSIFAGEHLYAFSLSISRAVNYSTDKYYKGKFEHKYVRSDWGCWFTDQIHGHLSKKYGTNSGSDGCSGVWKIDPDKFPTYKEWIADKYSRAYALIPGFEKSLLANVPKNLRTLKG